MILPSDKFLFFKCFQKILCQCNSILYVYLHLPQNAALHQKSLAQILLSLSGIINEILEQGIQEGCFTCEYPTEYSKIILSVFTFLLDPGIFTWTSQERHLQLHALADILEKGLGTASGSFSFLYSE